MKIIFVVMKIIFVGVFFLKQEEQQGTTESLFMLKEQLYRTFYNTSGSGTKMTQNLYRSQIDAIPDTLFVDVSFLVPIVCTLTLIGEESVSVEPWERWLLTLLSARSQLTRLVQSYVRRHTYVACSASSSLRHSMSGSLSLANVLADDSITLYA